MIDLQARLTQTSGVFEKLSDFRIQDVVFPELCDDFRAFGAEMIYGIRPIGKDGSCFVCGKSDVLHESLAFIESKVPFARCGSIPGRLKSTKWRDIVGVIYNRIMLQNEACVGW